MKPKLDEVANRMSSNSRKSRWRTYGELLGLSEFTLDEINQRYPNDPLNRVLSIHDHWIQTKSFLAHCIPCNTEVLVKALADIQEFSLLTCIIK